MKSRGPLLFEIPEILMAVPHSVRQMANTTMTHVLSD
jgi:hypothetical protein